MESECVRLVFSKTLVANSRLVSNQQMKKPRVFELIMHLLIGCAFITVGVYGWTTHEITLGNKRGVSSHHVHRNRDRTTTYRGLPADLVRMALIAIGIVAVTYPFFERAEAIRNNKIGLAVLVTIAVVYSIGHLLL